METLIVIVVLECAAVALTSVGCWFASWRRNRPGWYIGIVGPAGVGLAVLLSDANMLFHPSEWSMHKRSLEAYVWQFAITAGVGVVPALFVVWHFRKKFNNGTAQKV